MIHLLADAGGDLWTTTENGDITRYRQGGFQTYQAVKELNGKTVRQLFLNSKGNVTAFADTGAIEWDGEKFVSYAPVAGETSYSAVWRSKNGAFWFSNGQTVYRFQDGQTSEYRLPGTAGASFITKLFEYSRGRLWLGTVNSGMFMLENGKLTAYSDKENFSGTYVSPRMEDRNGNL